METARSAEQREDVDISDKMDEGHDEVDTVHREMQTSQSKHQKGVVTIVGGDVPFGRAKTPLSEPFWSALLNWEVKAASETPPRLLLVWTYFLMAWRLQERLNVSKCSSLSRTPLRSNSATTATTRCRYQLTMNRSFP